MDDTEDKLRRNLVAVSAAVLAASFLDYRLPAIASLCGLGAVDAAHTPRVWLACVFFILYLLGRYHFSEARIRSRAAWREDHQRRVQTYAKFYPRRRELKIRNQRQRERERKLLREKAAKSEATQGTGLRRFSMQDVGIANLAIVGRTLFYRAEWSDDEPGEFEHRYGNDDFNEEYAEMSNITLNSVQFVSLWGRSTLHNLIFSHGAFEVLAPYVLAALAIGGAMYKYMT